MEEDIKTFNQCIKSLKEFGQQNLSLFSNTPFEGKLKTIEFIFNKILARNKILEDQNEENIKALEEKINYLKTLNFGADLVTQSTANLTTICILEELLQRTIRRKELNMKIEIYKCDFCKNEVQENQLCNFYLGVRRYEVCKPCYEKGMTLKNNYEEKESRLYNEFTKEIEALIKEERN